MSHPTCLARAVMALVALAAAAAPLLAAPAPAGESAPNFRAILRETRQTLRTPDQVTVVWWMPEQLWRAAFVASRRYADPAEVEKRLAALRPYTVALFAEGRADAAGKVTPTPPEKVIADFRVLDADAAPLAPVKGDAISAEARAVIAEWQTPMANLLGPLGRSINFVLLPAADAKGRPVADAARPGTLRFTYAGKEVAYRLPLDAAMAPRACPKCGEKCRAAWSFCPVCGEKLPPAVPASAAAPAAEPAADDEP